MSTSMVCIFWAIRKKKEIEGMIVNLEEENIPLNLSSKQKIIEEQEDLDYISKILHDTVLMMLKKIFKISLMFFCGISILVWIFLEEKITNFAQAIYFFIGSVGQIVVGLYIFKNHNMFDARAIMFARVTKWNAMEHIVKLNNYITLSN